MKFAICQELYEKTDWATQCRLIAEAGYTGIEVAPFTISTDLASVPVAVFQEMKQEAERYGLEIIGLHWLLAKTTGLHLTSPEPAVRRQQPIISHYWPASVGILVDTSSFLDHHSNARCSRKSRKHKRLNLPLMFSAKQHRHSQTIKCCCVLNH